MKKLLLLAALALGLVNVHAQTLGQTMYIDFGPNAGIQGAITPSPDVNGNYWNNPTNAAVGSKTTIVNGTNVSTTIEMEVTDNFSLNSTQNYGPAPADAAVVLANLGIGTAFQDYFYVEGSNPTAQLTFRNLNPAKLYKFSVFGSRLVDNSVRQSKYVFAGATTVTGDLLTSTNKTNLFTTTLIAPTTTGTLTVDLSILQGGFGYLNLMKIEEYVVTAVDAPVATAIQSFCQSNNPTIASLTATGAVGSTLKWYSVSTSGTALMATTALVSGKYYVSQTVDGTESPRATVDVTVTPTPVTPVVTAQTTATFCAGGNVVLQSNTPEGTATYQWYKDNAIITGATSQNYTATTAGNYTVIVATTGSCASAASTAIAVTINALPVVASITGTTNVAKNGTSQLASVTTGGVWASSNTAVATVSAAGKVTAVAPGIATITYTVTANGCSNAASIEVTVTNGETLEQSMYIDFGPSTGTNGAITPSPDANGHYWNNPTNGALAAVIDVVNSNNADTGIDMEVTDNFVVNTTTNYGPTLTTGLNDLGIATATQDYFYLESTNPTGQLKFKNLDPAKGYKFTVFASRPTTSIRKTNYVFDGLNSFTGQIQTSNGTTGNLDTTLTTSILTPNAAGEIVVSLSIAQDVFGYINVMKIDQYSNLSIVNATAIAVTGNDITVSGQSSQMTATVTPTDATFKNVSWSVDNPSVATINAAGVLIPVSNGTVVVKATSAQNTAIFGTKTITISNQATSLYFSGTATENGSNLTTALPLHMVTGPNGAVSTTFEIYTSLNETGTFNFYTSQEAGAGTVYGAGATAGTIAGNGAGIDPTESGPVVITVNTATNTYTITPIAFSVVGSSIVNAWNGDAPLAYKGKGVWQAELDMSVVTSTDLNPRFVFKANKSWDYVMKKVTGSKNSVMKESTAKEFGVTLQDIDLKYGNFIITLDLSNYTYGIECTDIDENKISFMGSSVMNGTGATNMEGYAYKYNAILAERAKNGSPAFYRSNISIGGNNTTALLNRFEKDLVGDCSNYVIFGLALGNEGLHETGQVANDSYKANTQLLIQMARDINKVPVVMNSYVRNDYNATDYEFVKQTNLLMAQWDVPTVNTLGATDNGSGNWVTGYWSDSLHPNDAGHAELTYAIVPSLFDALDAKKPQPVLATDTYVTPSTTKSGELTYTPDAITHSFTVSFNVKTTATGNLMAFTTTNVNGTIAIDANGFIKYTAPAGGTITGNVAVNNDAWHKITLTHYYARSETLLYTDAALTGKTAEKLEPKVFTLHGTGAPANVSYGNWFFYRSGMNDLEIAALNDGKMLKSSLELYAPLDGKADAPFVNLAQSTTAINATNFTLGTGNVVTLSNNMTAYPNPVKDVLTVDIANNINIDSIEVYNPLGMLVTKAKKVKTINMSTLSAGVYLVKVSTANSSQTIKVIKQ